jgi:hypothetical protein
MLLPRLNALLPWVRSPWATGILAVNFSLYFLYHVVPGHLADLWPTLAPFGDAAILHSVSQRIWEAAEYPARVVFPYPPSAVLLFRMLSLGGAGAFMAAWIVLMAAGMMISIWASVASERADVRAAWMLFGVIGLMLAGYPVGWDLRNMNSNLVYLGLVLAGYASLRRFPILGGALIGISVSLKFYSGLLLLWLLWQGARSAAAAGIAAAIFLTAVLPLCIFGLSGTVELYLGWIEQVRYISAPTAYLLAPAAPLVSLRKAAATLTGAAPDATPTNVVLAAVWIAWAALLAWYLWRALRGPPAQGLSRATLADWTVLLLAPLPFSPWLEPYHAVPLLPAAILFAAVAFDPSTAAFDRRSTLAAIALLMCIRVTTGTFPPWQLRGLTLQAAFMVVVIGLGLLRPRLSTSVPGHGDVGCMPLPSRPARNSFWAKGPVVGHAGSDRSLERAYVVGCFLTLLFQAAIRLQDCMAFAPCALTLAKGSFWSLIWPVYWEIYLRD